jgi:hypothetical protein
LDNKIVLLACLIGHNLLGFFFGWLITSFDYGQIGSQLANDIFKICVCLQNWEGSLQVMNKEVAQVLELVVVVSTVGIIVGQLYNIRRL